MSNKIDLGSYGSVSTDEAKSAAFRAGNIALDYGKIKLEELKKYADEGDWTWKIAGFLAGLLVSGLSLLSFTSHFFGLSPFSAVMDVYLFVFGLIACVLEYKEHFLTEKYLLFLRKEALFLYRPYGRAAFYFFVGILILSQGGLLGIVVGLYTASIGAIIYYSSRAALSTLNSLKAGNLIEEDILAKFKMFDKDNSGSLDTSELSSLCQSLGANLNRNELESALFILDKNSDGKITYEEFLCWWQSKDDDVFGRV